MWEIVDVITNLFACMMSGFYMVCALWPSIPGSVDTDKQILLYVKAIFWYLIAVL